MPVVEMSKHITVIFKFKYVVMIRLEFKKYNSLSLILTIQQTVQYVGKRQSSKDHGYPYKKLIHKK